MKRIHVYFSGRVQGIGFRQEVSKKAKELGIKGFVQNLPNYEVELVAEGDELHLHQLITFCKSGIPGATIAKTKLVQGEATGEFSDFTVAFYGE